MDVIKKIPLKNSIKDQYIDCLIVNDDYYFLISTINRAYKYNFGLSDFIAIETEDKYKTITYNKNEDILYAIKENDNNNIFITDLQFKEIALIKLNVLEKYKDNINNIYYCDSQRRIYITTDNYVYSVTEDGYFIKEEYDISKVGTITTTTMVRELDGKTYPITTTSPIPNTCFTCSYILNNFLYIGYVKENSSYLKRISSTGEVVENNYIDSDIKINSIINVTDCINLLILSNDLYNYIYITDFKNNTEGCHWEQCRNKILESVALVTSSISSILNVESEKMKKVISESNNISEVIEASNSINKTIDGVASLEQLLLEQLEYCSKED